MARGWRVARWAGNGRWTVEVVADGETRQETFHSVIVCNGHHREAFVPEYPGTFSGTIIHSSTYKRPDPFHGQRVLVVGAGNSAVDIAVDVARVAAKTALSVRDGTYIVPRLMFGRPTDAVYALWRNMLPRPLLQAALKACLRLAIGRWEEYGLPAPAGAPLEQHPTVNSGVLDAFATVGTAASNGTTATSSTSPTAGGASSTPSSWVTASASASRSCPSGSPVGT